PISPAAEVACFANAHARNWIEGDRGFGLHYVQAQPRYLGVAVERAVELFLARFEDGNNNQRWHGYPADPQRRVGDRLPEQIKRERIRDSVLPRPKVRKLQRGQPCKL